MLWDGGWRRIRAAPISSNDLSSVTAIIIVITIIKPLIQAILFCLKFYHGFNLKGTFCWKAGKKFVHYKGRIE